MRSQGLSKSDQKLLKEVNKKAQHALGGASEEEILKALADEGDLMRESEAPNVLNMFL